jgi:4-hydroxy-2-oxoheptanedioate aldolase
MRQNQLKTQWAANAPVINGWLAIPSSFSAEVMAHQGFDSLTVDMQHGVMGYETVIAMFQAISTTNVTPLVRVPWNDPASIMRMLDGGAYGVVCPMINTRSEAERFVGACRYSPQGYRSFGPARARLYGGSDYASSANDTIVTFAMIETAQALANLDDILSTPGLDGIYVGPADLSLSLTGKVSFDYSDPELFARLEQIVAATRRHGVAAGIHTGSPEFAQRMIDLGYRFVTIQSDAGFIESYAKRVISTLKQPVTEQGVKGPY